MMLIFTLKIQRWPRQTQSRPLRQRPRGTGRQRPSDSAAGEMDRAGVESTNREAHLLWNSTCHRNTELSPQGLQVSETRF